MTVPMVRSARTFYNAGIDRCDIFAALIKFVL